MNKRLLSIILAMVLALSLAPTAAVAQEAPAEAEGYIEESVSPEEGSEEAALQETMTEAQSEEQTESSAEAVISDETSEIQSGESVESVGSDVSSEVQTEDSTNSTIPIGSAGSDIAAGNISSGASENNIDSELSSESSVDSSTGIGEQTSQDDTQGDVTQDASTSSAAAAVQALIDALPDADSIDESNMEDVINQLNAIDDARILLSDEEAASLDFTRYEAAISVLTGDETGSASTPMLTNETPTDINDEAGLISAMSTGGSFKLTNRITLTAECTVSSAVSLDLNGKSITGNFAIIISTGASLTISDSSTGGSGQISSSIQNSNVLQISSGTISGSIQNELTGTFTISGGTVSDQITNNGVLTMTGWY